MSGCVIVTGLGVVSPLGQGVKENWKNLIGADRASARNDTRGPAHTGFERACELSQLAAAEALADAGLWDGESLQNIDPERIGCTVSVSKPLATSSPAVTGRGSMDSPPGSAGNDVCWAPPDTINDFVANRFGLRGECRNVIAACATGAYAIALGASWIEQGLCDMVLAGSVEPYPHPLIQSGFKQMGVISAEGVTRPFDLRRSGFTFGEGAGVMVLESEVFAHRRLASGRGRLTGWALGSDSHSAVAFNSNGAHIADVIGRALDRGGLSAADIDHVNAHGTGTRLNDWIETQALIKTFGSHADRLMISATKASTGHLLGASGSVEFIFSVLALKHQYIPPTATLEVSDPDCRLDYTPKTGHPAAVRHALSLSFGFGGPIGALAVSAC